MSTERIDVEALRGHTQGPWEVVHDHPQNACCCVVLKDRHLIEIATLYSSPSSPESPIGGIWPEDLERDANGRLIAAAPALLAEVIERRARDAAVAELVKRADDAAVRLLGSDDYHDRMASDSLSDALAAIQGSQP